MKYEFGIGTNKWELEAKTDFIAHLTMVLFTKSQCPIAIYEPRSHAIDPNIILDTDSMPTAKQSKEIRDCLQTITTLTK